MHYMFDFRLARMEYELNDDALIYRNINWITPQHKVVPWPAIIQAGYYPMSKDMPEGDLGLAVAMPPGVGNWFNRRLAMQRETDQVLVGYQLPNQHRAVLYLIVRKHDPQTAIMIDHLRKQLGERWLREDIVSINQFRRQLRISNLWVNVGVALFVIVGVPLVLLLFAGWASIEAEWSWYIALATSIAGAVGVLWRQLRNRWR